MSCSPPKPPRTTLPNFYVILKAYNITIRRNLISREEEIEIPGQSTLAPVGGDAKVVLEAGDAIKVQSNIASSIDVVLSYLEQT